MISVIDARGELGFRRRWFMLGAKFNAVDVMKELVWIAAVDDYTDARIHNAELCDAAIDEFP